MKKKLLSMVVVLAFAMTFFVGCAAKNVDVATAKADLTAAIGNVQTVYAKGMSADISAKIKTGKDETAMDMSATAKVQFKIDTPTDAAATTPVIQLGVTAKVIQEKDKKKETYAEVGFIYDGTNAYRYFDSEALASMLAAEGIVLDKAIKTALTPAEFFMQGMALIKLLGNIVPKSPMSTAMLPFAETPVIPDIFEYLDVVSASIKGGNTTVILKLKTVEGAEALPINLEIKIAYDKEKIINKLEVSVKSVAGPEGAEAMPPMDISFSVSLSGAPSAIDTSFNTGKEYVVGDVFDFIPKTPVDPVA